MKSTISILALYSVFCGSFAAPSGRRSPFHSLAIMGCTKALWILFICSAMISCARVDAPTALPVPVGATELRQFSFLNGAAHQTDFKMQIRYPATPAFEHYAKNIQQPWVRCEWSDPEWQRFLDGTANPPNTVHQQLHMWINPESRRILTLGIRYLSSKDCIGNPENDTQRVVVIEHFNQDTKAVVEQLNLKCPGGISAL